MKKIIIAILISVVVSCTTDRREKDLELGKRLSALECNQTVNLMNSGEYSYLFKRFSYAYGMVDLGGINYSCQSSKKGGSTIYNLTGKDSINYYQVRIYERDVLSAGGTVQCMQIKKVPRQYESIKIGSFELTLLEYNDPYVSLFVENKDAKPFAYAEQTQLTNHQPYAGDLRFSLDHSLKIKVQKNRRLILYDYEDGADGVKLSQKAYIPYLVNKFDLY